jgi:20S proteasome alpha/beta subunit
MTLCISAACHYAGPTLICCCDASTTRDDVTSQSSIKMVWFGEAMNPSVNVMLAGRLHSAKELVEYCRPSLNAYCESDHNDLAVNALLKGLREAIAKRRAALNDEYLTTQYAIRFADFLTNGQQWFSGAERGQILAELRTIGLYDASLIISSFTDGEPLIIEVTNDGHVAWVDHFAVQGTGARLANAFLQQRDYDDYMEIDECLFRILEAKRAAERDPYVGSDTHVRIFTAREHFVLLNKGEFTNLIASRESVPALPTASLVSMDDYMSNDK